MASAALRQAAAEGLTLQRSEAKAGFKGVAFQSGKAKPYYAGVRRGGKTVNLGSFATAEEAALCYQRDVAANGAPRLTGAAAAAALAPLTAEEALRQAEAEGLTLQPSEGKTGFKGVKFDSRGSSEARPYQAQVTRGGKYVFLGSFATAEDAALCYARDMAANGAPGLSASAASKAAAAAAPAPLTAEEALRQAAAEGLTLQPSDTMSGFKGVSYHSKRREQAKPYEAHVSRSGKLVHLGIFATAEEAALGYARDIAVNGAPAQRGQRRSEDGGVRAGGGAAEDRQSPPLPKAAPPKAAPPPKASPPKAAPPKPRARASSVVAADGRSYPPGLAARVEMAPVPPLCPATPEAPNPANALPPRPGPSSFPRRRAREPEPTAVAAASAAAARGGAKRHRGSGDAASAQRRPRHSGASSRGEEPGAPPPPAVVAASVAAPVAAPAVAAPAAQPTGAAAKPKAGRRSSERTKTVQVKTVAMSCDGVAIEPAFREAIPAHEGLAAVLMGRPRLGNHDVEIAIKRGARDVEVVGGDATAAESGVQGGETLYIRAVPDEGSVEQRRQWGAGGIAATSRDFMRWCVLQPSAVYDSRRPERPFSPYDSIGPNSQYYRSLSEAARNIVDQPFQ